MLSLFPGPPGVFGGNNQLDTHAQQLTEMRSRIEAIKKALTGLRAQRDSVHRELENTEKDIGKISKVLHRLKAERQSASKKHKQLLLDKQAQQQRLDVLGKLLARDLRSAYLMGKQERVKLILNQEDPAVAGRMVAYHGYFTGARMARMHRVHAALNSLHQTEAELLGQIARIGEIQEETRLQSEKLGQRQAVRHTLLEQLQAELGSRSSELDELRRNERQLERLIKSLRQVLRDIPPTTEKMQPFKSLKGKLSWPVSGHVSQRYGQRQAAGKLKSRGVRIDAPEGAPVHAISTGRVAFADWLRGFGLLLIIEHGDGYMSLYGHNRSLFREVGEWVRKDEVVAEVGNSGGSLQAGLYLELRKDGRPVNPTPWFSGHPATRKVQR